MITQGLLMWPYFTFARLIAPCVVAGKGQEYRPEWAGVILTVLVVSTVVSAFHVRGRSSPTRRVWVAVAVIVGAIGVVERLVTPVYGVVR